MSSSELFQTLTEISDRICGHMAQRFILEEEARLLIPKQNYERISQLSNEMTHHVSEIRALQLNVMELAIDDKDLHSILLRKNIMESGTLLNGEKSVNFRCYPVIPEMLYAGEIPSSVMDELLHMKLNELARLGVTKIINLTEEGEKNFKGIPLRDYDEYLREIETQNGKSMEMIRLSIPDLDIPSVEHMKDIQSTIRNFLFNGETVYVHCWGGIGRTGTVIGCFLIENGILTTNNVLTYIEFLKRNTEIHDRNSPETDDQCNFIYSWERL